MTDKFLSKNGSISVESIRCSNQSQTSKIPTKLTILFLLLLSLAGTALAGTAREEIFFTYYRGQHINSIKLYEQAREQAKKGDLTNALRSLDTALKNDPTFWPAIYFRGDIFAHQRQYERAVKEFGEALRQKPTFIEAAIGRAAANKALGRYDAALREIDHLAKIRPGRQYALILNHRAWYRATIPDAQFRNGKQAVSDAKAACNVTKWEDPEVIDTLAAAYADTGDFANAIKYQEQAMAKDSKKVLRNPGPRLVLYKEQKPFREK